MNTSGKRGSGRSLAADTQAAAGAQPLRPPKDLPKLGLPLWDAVMETRLPQEWRAIDRSLVNAYVRALLDIEQLHDQMLRESFSVGSKVNPLLPALNYRLSHAAMLNRMLGLTAPKPRTTDEREVLERQRRDVKGALDTLASDTTLLAGPMN